MNVQGDWSLEKSKLDYIEPRTPKFIYGVLVDRWETKGQNRGNRDETRPGTEFGYQLEA